ncbi:hypothetical protein C8R43DRAFT_603152 [Mycena crocata]|nr:hypothetical protein C8R43DRAFT_603152 [Mycena crocata]
MTGKTRHLRYPPAESPSKLPAHFHLVIQGTDSPRRFCRYSRVSMTSSGRCTIALCLGFPHHQAPSGRYEPRRGRMSHDCPEEPERRVYYKRSFTYDGSCPPMNRDKAPAASDTARTAHQFAAIPAVELCSGFASTVILAALFLFAHMNMECLETDLIQCPVSTQGGVRYSLSLEWQCRTMFGQLIS